MSVAAAGAIIVGGLGGVSAAAAEAEPGSPFFTVTKFLYADRAHARMERHHAAKALEKARQAMREGRTGDAKRLLAEAQKHLKGAGGEAEQGQLASEAARIAGELPPEPPGGISPGDPKPIPPEKSPSAQPSPDPRGTTEKPTKDDPRPKPTPTKEGKPRPTTSPPPPANSPSPSPVVSESNPPVSEPSTAPQTKRPKTRSI